MISAIAPTTSTATKTVTTTRVIMTNEEVEAYMMAEMISQFGGMYISNKPDTQVSLATTVKSVEENDSSVTNKVEATTNNHQQRKQQGEDLTSSQVVTSESITASLAIIAKGDQFENDMMATGADLFGVPDDGNASSPLQTTTKKSQSITTTTVVPSRRNQQHESSMTEITRGVNHLTIICNAMEEDEDEMEVDLPEPEEEDVWMAEPWEIMEVDDPDEKDIDWMELL